MTQLTQADAPKTGERQYHIGLERGELSEYVLLVGDPGRVAKVSSRWDAIELERSNREITTATGTYRGMRISCMSTGMGTDNVEIVLAEVMEITDAATFIRIGSSGALQPEIELGDLIVSTGAVRLENTTDFYVHPGSRRLPTGMSSRRWRRPFGSGLPPPPGADGDGQRVLRSAGTCDAHAPRSLS